MAFSSVIDLGTIEVEGEVRQPRVQFYNSAKVADSHIKSVAEKQINILEQQIIQNLIKMTGDKNERK